MATLWSSVSHCSRTKVRLLKTSSLVLVIPLFLGLKCEAVTRPGQVQWNHQEVPRCDFQGDNGVSNLISCMQDLATRFVFNRDSRIDERPHQFFSSPQNPQFNDYVQYQPSPSAEAFYRPFNSHRGPSHSVNRPQRYPPALPPGYPLETASNYGPGILGVNLLDALSSISQYDDRKCVPRILCEVATGVIPGNSNYKQSYGGLGMNSLVSLLTAFDTGESSPLLTFGKSALMGYTNRGNPEVCYRQYPRCPRDPTAVVEYLNNHNGGFFRFFSNRNSGYGYRAAVINRRPAPPPGISGAESDRKGTGNLNFDSPSVSSDQTASSNFNIFPQETRTLISFPEEAYKRREKSLDDEIKSFTFPN